MSRNIRLLLEYDGTAFSGWQLQKQGEDTIQGRLEEAIRRVCGKHSRIMGAGRTDAGVHALGQVASFKTDSSIDAAQFAAALNANLPAEITVLKSEEADPDFDPRRMARGKIYSYRILNRPVRSSLLRDRAWLLRPKMDIDAMRRAADFLVGENDYKSFQGSGCAAKHTVRYIYSIEIESDPATQGLYRIDIFATAFLKHMVRNIAGTLAQVGLGKIDAKSIEDILRAKNRSAAGPTAPPQGLFLLRIFYPDDPPPPHLMRLIPESHRIVRTFKK